MREQRLDELKEQIGWPDVAPDSPLATMGWGDVDRLARTGLARFGSHTHNHPILSKCRPEVQRRELQCSREYPAGTVIPELFAYPNGGRDDFSPATKSLLEEIGYHCGVTTIPGLNTPDRDRFELPGG